MSLLMFAGCDDFESVNTDPDATTEVTSAMLATGLIRNLTTHNNGTSKGSIREDLLGKYLSWTEPMDIDYAFNLLGRASYSSISNLRNASKMIGFAQTEGLSNSYTALAHFIRVYFFFDTTMRLGDIPYSEALQGEDGEIYFPKYDSQREIFIGLLKELDEADRLFSIGEDFDGDYMYGGSVAKWRKAVNVLQLKILLNLYKKTDDADLNVKARIKELVNNRPLFESNADNFQVVYSNKGGQYYPLYTEISDYGDNDAVTCIIIDKLKELQDYRLFYYAKPTPNAEKAGADPSAWDSYNGVDPMLPESDILSVVSEGNISQLNDRYEQLPEGEPIFILSYQEQNFILAEMALRGLVDGDAKAYYEEAVRSSLQFVADNTPDNAQYHHNRKITSDYIAEYLQKPGVAFASDFQDRLEQIIWQKYITSFLQIPFNAFFEYRRTGIPDFPINPKSNRNTPSDKMPLRWMYPQDELNYNMDNVSQAINSQYGGSDDYMGVMWLLQ